LNTRITQRVETLSGMDSVRSREYSVTVQPGGPENMTVELTRDSLNEVRQRLATRQQAGNQAAGSNFQTIYQH